MEQVYSTAGNRFDPEMVQRLRGMGLGVNDFLDLTRDDLNSEFKGYSFVQRKKLWTFIETQKDRLRGKSPEMGGEQSFSGYASSGPDNAKLGAEYGEQTGPRQQPPPAYDDKPQGSGDHGRAGDINVPGTIGSHTQVGHGNSYNSQSGSGNVNVRVGRAGDNVNVAGGNITSTTYNAPKDFSKYRINMDRAKGVAIGDHSTVHGSFF